MTESLIERWFETAEILAIWNRCPLKFSIQGSQIVVGCDENPLPHHHVSVEATVQMFGLPDKATVEEAVIYFGWGLEKQIEMVYLTSDVPDDIIWTGHVAIGLIAN